MKIVLINHTFQKERFYKRWKLLAESHPDLDVTLLAPAEWTWGDSKTLTFGFSENKKGKVVDEGNFHIRLIDIKKHKFRSWTSNLMEKYLREIKPDVIYFIGLHTQDALQQLISIKKRWLPQTKLLAFSMRGKYHALRVKKDNANIVKKMLRRAYYLFLKWKIKRMNKYCDAIFCHYPDGRDEFKREGYKGNIYMQTQVGYDGDYFYPDEVARKKIRDKYSIGDAYCFGSASRFNPSKGLFDIIQALPQEGNWKFLMMGSGTEEENLAIQNAISQRNLESKIILTGYIDLEDMSEYWNALDCAVHIPRTTETWEETFSLALVQAMATGLPVIGNTSGSVPYQIGKDGIIIEEGNIVSLNEQFVFAMTHVEQMKSIGKKMQQRAMRCFEIRQLNELFYRTIIDIHNGQHDNSKTDMTTYW